MFVYSSIKSKNINCTKIKLFYHNNIRLFSNNLKLFRYVIKKIIVAASIRHDTYHHSSKTRDAKNRFLCVIVGVAHIFTLLEQRIFTRFLLGFSFAFTKVETVTLCCIHYTIVTLFKVESLFMDVLNFFFKSDKNKNKTN